MKKIKNTSYGFVSLYTTSNITIDEVIAGPCLLVKYKYTHFIAMKTENMIFTNRILLEKHGTHIKHQIYANDEVIIIYFLVDLNT